MRLSWVGVVRPSQLTSQACLRRGAQHYDAMACPERYVGRTPAREHSRGGCCKITQTGAGARCSFLLLGEFRYLRPIMFSVIVVPAFHRDLCELPDAASARSLPFNFLSASKFLPFHSREPKFVHRRHTVCPSPLPFLRVADDFICLSRTVAKWSDGVGWHRRLSSLPTRQMLILTCHQLMST